MTPSCPAIRGDRSTVSAETALRNWARSLRAPLAWFFTATRVIAPRISCASTPYAAW